MKLEYRSSVVYKPNKNMIESSHLVAQMILADLHNFTKNYAHERN